MLVKSIFSLTLKSSVNQVKCTNPVVKQPILNPKNFSISGHKKKASITLLLIRYNRVLSACVVALATSQFQNFSVLLLFPNPFQRHILQLLHHHSIALHLNFCIGRVGKKYIRHHCQTIIGK
jgi:hypothetical protein